MYFIGIDVGTFESKGVLVGEQGEVLAKVAAPHTILTPKKGHVEHDADKTWWSDCTYIIRQLLEISKVPPSDIRCVGLSAIGPTLLPVNKEGKPLRPAILYGIDTRAYREIEELNFELDTEEIFKRTGNSLSSQAIGPKILWVKKNEPEIYRESAKFLTATSYLVYKLTGSYVIDSYTAASWCPIFNIHTLDWDTEFTEKITDRERLCDIKQAIDIAGFVSMHAAKETGLCEGTPVITGTTDALSEAISAGVVSNGDMMVMYGTTTFFVCNTPKLIPSRVLWANLHAVPDMFTLTGGMSTTGALTRWFLEQFGIQGTNDSHEELSMKYEKLTLLLEQSPPGANQLVTLPYFSGERTPIHDPHAKGMIFGLSLHHTRADVYRSLIEGIAYGVRNNIEAMRNEGCEINRIVAVGGGTKNKKWLQAVSDIADIVQHVPENTVGAAYGDAMLAAIAVGHISIDQSKDWVQYKEEITPNPKTRPIYEPLYQTFRTLYSHTKEDMKGL